MSARVLLRTRKDGEALGVALPTFGGLVRFFTCCGRSRLSSALGLGGSLGFGGRSFRRSFGRCGRGRVLLGLNWKSRAFG